MIVISTRQQDPRLEKLFEDGKKVYSISKLNTIHGCEYEAYLRYIQHSEGKDGVYGIMGTRVHDTLEEIMQDKATKEDLLPALKDELENLCILDLDFPKDFKGGTSIRDNWIADMTHSCKNFIKPKGKFTTEELFIYKLDDDHYLQGYIDLIRHNEDGTISIIDWKTSSNFSKDDLIHHGRQLVLYALAKEAEGHKVKNVMWYMLKYVQVKYMGRARSNSKKDTEITKIINRGKLIKELLSPIKHVLKQNEYDDIESGIILDRVIKTNSLDALPEKIQNQFSIKPYVHVYPLTEELKNETLDYISSMIEKFESKSENEDDWQCKNFIDEKGREDTFYCNVLCSYRQICKHIKKHNDLRQLLNKKDEDLF